MNTSERIPPNDSKCDNCGEELRGLFCWVCGQKDTHYNRSVFKVVGDFFKEMFDVDSRVFTTLSTLFFRPGKLSIQFRENRRAGYVTPIRLYLFSSLVFFFLVAITSRMANVQVGEQNEFGPNQLLAQAALELGDSDSESDDESPSSINIQLGNRSLDRGSDSEASLAGSTFDSKPETPDPVAVDEYLTSIRSVFRRDEELFQSAKNVLKQRIVSLVHDPWCEEIFAAVDAIDDQMGMMPNDLRLREAIQRAEQAHKRMRVIQEFFPDDPVTRAKGEEIVNTSKHGELLSTLQRGLSVSFHIHEADGFREIPPIEKQFIKLAIHAVYDGKEFVEDITENLPLMMFVLLPIFVSLLALLSLGKGIRVVFQLIFAMHVHALAFVTLIFGVLLALILDSAGLSWVGFYVFVVLSLYIACHFYLSFKNFYASGHVVSLLKFTFLLIVYAVILLLGLGTMVVFRFLAPGF